MGFFSFDKVGACHWAKINPFQVRKNGLSLRRFLSILVYLLLIKGNYSTKIVGVTFKWNPRYSSKESFSILPKFCFFD